MGKAVAPSGRMRSKESDEIGAFGFLIFSPCPFGDEKGDVRE